MSDTTSTYDAEFDARALAAETADEAREAIWQAADEEDSLFRLCPDATEEDLIEWELMP